ncbi:MAG TPA: alpha/beta hydrolase [Anaerolineales bacterium]|nr:alpha/beta hydrolase [Anaerolineales bacterium]
MDNLKLEETFINTNGIKLHTVMAGPQSGSPVVLLHGFPETWRCWIRQLPALAAAGCRVIVPDQRGYNLSDKPRGIENYRMEELTSDILGLIDSLEYEKVNLVGHDFGALVAWMLATKHPERLHRLGIINVPHPAVMWRFLRRDFEQMRRSLYALFFQLPWLPEMVMSVGNWRGASLSLRRSGKPHAFTDEDIEKYTEAWSQPGAMTAMLNWYRAAARYRPELTNGMRVSTRTLILWGVQDFALSRRMARPSLDYCDDGSLVFFPDATHWVQREEADEVNRHLLGMVFS